MPTVEKSINVHVPVRTAYNQWTQFEEFPKFMEGVEEVRQLDDTHLYWRTRIAGNDEEWEAEITEQIPDERIAWRSTGGTPNGGVVMFRPVSDVDTQVMVQMTYEPQGVVEKAGDMLGIVEHRIEKDLERFKAFIEKRGAATGAWRGEVP
ncbi:MAG: SRPBCC family protein [Gammaproteobacteria bacterium]